MKLKVRGDALELLEDYCKAYEDDMDWRHIKITLYELLEVEQECSLVGGGKDETETER